MKAVLDYLIVGQGLAGSTLARLLLDRGRRLMVVDAGDPSGASRVAGGLVNPVTGMKLVKTREAEVFLPKARTFYRSWEREAGQKFYHDRTVWRLFRTEKEETVWQKKRETGELDPFVAELPETLGLELREQRGGFVVREAAYLDTVALLDWFRGELRRRESLVEEVLNVADLHLEEGMVRWRDIRARRIIFCEGHTASQNPWFSWIPFRNAKGEVLTISGQELPEDLVLNRGKWLLPISPGRYRAGATYSWKDLDSKPTDAGREEILAGIRKIVPWEPKVEKHEAGIRPIVQDTYPVLGLHPAHSTLGIFNGLGSKGVLWAPHFADQLVSHLEDGGSLEPAADVRRNL